MVSCKVEGRQCPCFPEAFLGLELHFTLTRPYSMLVGNAIHFVHAQTCRGMERLSDIIQCQSVMLDKLVEHEAQSGR